MKLIARLNTAAVLLGTALIVWGHFHSETVVFWGGVFLFGGTISATLLLARQSGRDTNGTAN